ncbi:hypothetical protein FSS13T_01500 [Flavobacterium saliperosum S13]|uniref:Uncharacterized protein n=1 Tax=Flavobacterium saliperosum S13 TaxID=1341155 RepID=A0ABP2ZYT6_9FLAO|nr:hypothetical protein FSS13T_01500 [Flavobacterium saliperosum S13]
MPFVAKTVIKNLFLLDSAYFQEMPKRLYFQGVWPFLILNFKIK